MSLPKAAKPSPRAPRIAPMDRRLALVAFVASLVTAPACSSAKTDATPAGDAGTADADRACAPPPGEWVEGRDPPAHCVKQVTGAVRARGGGPLAGMNVTLCGVVCFGALTRADGGFTVDVGARLPDGGYAVFLHGRPHHASTFVRLPSGPPERVDLGAPIELDPLTPGARLPADDAPASSVTAGPITLKVDAGTSWDLAFEDITDEAEGRTLRYAEVDPARAPAFAEGARLVYALAPFEAKPSKKVGVTLAASGGMPAGTPVELVVMGGTSLERVNTSGVAVVAARGRVSADGARIETDPGEGIGLVTWLAVRPAR